VPNFLQHIVIFFKMAFFRIKEVKGKEYAYAVENKWKKGSKQKVIGYLGRAYRFEEENSIEFCSFFNINDLNPYLINNDKNKIIMDLIEWEFFKFGIDKARFFIDLNNGKIQNNQKNAVFLINDGFMCGQTIKNLLGFKPDGDKQADGYRLARAFVEAGIKVPQEVFVGIFGKLYKPESIKKDFEW